MATVSEVEVLIKGNDSDLQSTLQRGDTSVQNFAQRVGNHLRRMDIFDTLRRGIIDIGQFAITSAMEFETAFANVEKTVDGTEQELSALRDSIRDMATDDVLGSLENAHQQLANLAAVGGQLGVATPALDEFASNIAALGVAADGLDTETMATFAARFANITGMDIATEIDNWASAVANLGNKSAATEGDILTFANRLANLSSFGFDDTEILAYGTALSSLGVSAELGGTNLVKSVAEMTTAVATGSGALQTYADVAGMTKDAFTELAATDPEAAFEEFVQGLSELDTGEQLQALQAIGATSMEQQRVFLSLASATDTLAQAQVDANEGWQLGNVHMEEAEKKAATTAGQMNVLKNNLTDLGIEMGDRFLPAINEVVSGLTDMAQGEGGLTQVSAGFGEILDQVEDISGIDLGSFVMGPMGEDTDMSAGVTAFIDSMKMAPEAISIILDSMGKDFQRFWIELQLNAMQGVLGMRDMIMEATGGEIDIAPNLHIAATELEFDLTNINLAEQLESGLRNQMAGGEINLDSMMADMGEGVMMPIADMIAIDPAGIAEKIGEPGRQAVADALAMAFAEGDQAAISVLTPIANELELDVEAIRNDMADGIASQDYEALATVDVTVAAGYINFDPLNAAVNSAVGTAVQNAAAGQPTPSVSGGSGGGTSPATLESSGHTGGVFRHPAGEGWAFLKTGEIVQTPEQRHSTGKGNGKGGDTFYVQSYGQHPSELTRMIDRTRKDAGR